MMISIYDNYTNEHRKIEFDFEKIVSDFKKYEVEKEISLILVDLDEIKKINKEYRAKDCPTDVISFESQIDTFDFFEDEVHNYLGDIFICIEKVLEQAKLYGHSLEREFAFLLVHGMLHLQGYDHIDGSDEKIMFAKQEEILNDYNYKR